jgi:hypothetical protein
MITDTVMPQPPTKPIRFISEEELRAVTRDDILYQAAAQVMIRRGLWVVVKSNEVRA